MVEQMVVPVKLTELATPYDLSMISLRRGVYSIKTDKYLISSTNWDAIFLLSKYVLNKPENGLLAGRFMLSVSNIDLDCYLPYFGSYWKGYSYPKTEEGTVKIEEDVFYSSLTTVGDFTVRFNKG